MLNEEHLRRLIRNYVRYHHEDRIHGSLNKDTPNPRSVERKPSADYLFLAFNTSTAFSPTDVPVLSRWAKAMMMVQSCISLGTVVVLGARAVNIL